MKLSKKFAEYAFLMYLGGTTYMSIEVCWRGYSHWSMGILGAMCFVLLGLINEILPWETPIELQALIGSVIITVLEFITGCIINLWLGWHVWDYSNIPFNLLGQICLPFCLLWLVISTAAIIIDDYCRYYIFKEEKPHYKSILLKRNFK